MSDQFGSFFPIWQWSPILVALFVLGIDFGAIMAIRIFVEKKVYLTRWWSFKIGDTIGLPVCAGFAAAVVSEGNFTGFYTQLWWHLLVLMTGYTVIITLELNSVRVGFATWEEVTNPSQMYHTFIFGIMFYLFSTVMFALVADHQPVVQTIMAFCGLGVWLTTYVIDQTSLVDKTPGRYRN